MSRKKHNISYIKPDEPKFLRELKEKVGYKEGPTIDTKRETLPQCSDDEKEDYTEEKPVVVVLKSGDLTAEEAETFQKQKEQEIATAPADLSKRIIFRKHKSTDHESNKSERPKKKTKRTPEKKAIVSFSDNEEDFV